MKLGKTQDEIEVSLIGEQSWAGVLATAQAQLVEMDAELQRVQRRRRRLQTAIKLCKEQIALNAPWPRGR